MSLGRLLKSGKSLIGGADLASSFGKNKYVTLPKFISPRNPFADRTKKELARPVAPAVIVKSPATVASQPATPDATGGTVSAAPNLPAAATVRRWLASAGSKLNPLPRLKREPRAARAAAGASVPVQAELSLERVRVVRNDFSELDAAPGPARALVPEIKSAPVAQVVAKAELVGQAMDHLSNRLFGDAG